MYKTIEKEKSIQQSGNKIHQKQQRSGIPTVDRVMGSYDSGFGVIQMHKIPEDLDKHQEDLEKVINAIEKFPVDDNYLEYEKEEEAHSSMDIVKEETHSSMDVEKDISEASSSSTPSANIVKSSDLEIAIYGANHWARETWLAALRKYNEMHVTLNRSEKENILYQLGRNEKKEPDLFFKQEGNTDSKYVEVKTISGKIDKIKTNVEKAYGQLEKRREFATTAIMEIIITEDTWKDVMSSYKNKSVFLDLIDDTAEYKIKEKFIIAVFSTPDGEIETKDGHVVVEKPYKNLGKRNLSDVGEFKDSNQGEKRFKYETEREDK